MLSRLPIPFRFAVCAHPRPIDQDGSAQRAGPAGSRHPRLAVRLATAKEGRGGVLITEDVAPIPLRVAAQSADGDWAREIEPEKTRAFDIAPARFAGASGCMARKHPVSSSLSITWSLTDAPAYTPCATC